MWYSGSTSDKLDINTYNFLFLSRWNWNGCLLNVGHCVTACGWAVPLIPTPNFPRMELIPLCQIPTTDIILLGGSSGLCPHQTLASCQMVSTKLRNCNALSGGLGIRESKIHRGLCECFMDAVNISSTIDVCQGLFYLACNIQPQSHVMLLGKWQSIFQMIAMFATD